MVIARSYLLSVLPVRGIRIQRLDFLALSRETPTVSLAFETSRCSRTKTAARSLRPPPPPRHHQGRPRLDLFLPRRALRVALRYRVQNDSMMLFLLIIGSFSGGGGDRIETSRDELWSRASPRPKPPSRSRAVLSCFLCGGVVRYVGIFFVV